MPRVAYVNGQYILHHDAAVHIEDRGFQFADSVYEAIALMDGYLADEAGHLDRLERSMSELDMDLPMSRKALQIAIRETVRRNRIRNAFVYIQVSRGAAPRNFEYPAHTLGTVVITVRQASYVMPAAKKVITVPDIRWLRRDIKTTGLLAQSMAKQDAKNKGADDAWMVDEKGYVTEATASNAWIVDKKGRLITRPATHNTILKGVTRNAIIMLCKEEGLELIERAFTVAEAKAAAEAFMSGAIAQIVPVASIDGEKIGTGETGPVARKMREVYAAYATDKTRKQKRWNDK